MSRIRILVHCQRQDLDLVTVHLLPANSLEELTHLNFNNAKNAVNITEVRYTKSMSILIKF
jgi:hypothetical protein